MVPEAAGVFPLENIGQMAGQESADIRDTGWATHLNRFA